MPTILGAVFDKSIFRASICRLVISISGGLDEEIERVEITRGKTLYQPEPDRHPELAKAVSRVRGSFGIPPR